VEKYQQVTPLRRSVEPEDTNGQAQIINGTQVYTLYYTAEIQNTVKLGNRPPGTVETYNSNYAFHWTEKGWMGPDNQVYPEH